MASKQVELIYDDLSNSNHLSQPKDNISVVAKTSNDIDIDNFEQLKETQTQYRNGAIKKRGRKAFGTTEIKKRGRGRPRKLIIESCPLSDNKNEIRRYRNRVSQRNATIKKNEKRQKLVNENENLFTENKILQEQTNKAVDQICDYLYMLQEFLSKEHIEKLLKENSLTTSLTFHELIS